MPIAKHKCLISLTTLVGGLIAMWASPAAANPQCIPDWSDAAPVVRREGLRSVRDVQDQTRNTLGADVVRITLCKDDGAYIYRLTVRAANGRVSNTTVNARFPGR
ncbi:MAG: PepSY domain-containing protein [Hyphomicrobiaceae bacterium]